MDPKELRRAVVPLGEAEMVVGVVVEKKEVYRMQVGAQMQGRTFSLRGGKYLRGLQGSFKVEGFGIGDGVCIGSC